MHSLFYEEDIEICYLSASTYLGTIANAVKNRVCIIKIVKSCSIPKFLGEITVLTPCYNEQSENLSDKAS